LTSLLLDSNWDLTLDAFGNLAITAGNYAVAQDAACACRTWRGELWYDTTRGVPYQQIMGHRPPSIQFVKQALLNEVYNVINVASAKVFLTGPGVDRQLGGQIQIIETTGQVIAVANATAFAGDTPWWVSALPQS
jgi:hypothetical protein